MVLPNQLSPGLLYLFVLGPGVGETVLIHVPPADWIVIDSYRHKGRPAAAQILNKYRAVWSTLVLTHPHADHYPGFDELLEMNPAGTVGCAHPRASDLAVDGSNLPLDPMRHLSNGALPIYDAIWQRWQRVRNSQWDTYRRVSHNVGEVTLTALHPDRPLTDADWDRKPNELSSAILLSWADLTVLLGADVENTQWPRIAEEFRSLNTHAGLKVPHHGSKGAVHSSYARGHSNRCWVITPYSRPPRLPRSEDDEGLDLLLREVSSVYVTALPFRHDCEDAEDCDVTRQSIRLEVRPKPIDVPTLPGGRRGTAPAIATGLECYVVVAFGRSGEVLEIHRGRGTMRVSNA